MVHVYQVLRFLNIFCTFYSSSLSSTFKCLNGDLLFLPRFSLIKKIYKFVMYYCFYLLSNLLWHFNDWI